MKFLHEYIKYYDDEPPRENGYWEINGDQVYNICGGRHSYIPTDNDEIIEAEDWDDLYNNKIDWSYLITPDSKYGWIDRDGRFYGCKYESHKALAENYFHKNERELEKLGWIKVFKNFSGKTEWYIDYGDTVRGAATDAQLNTLVEKEIIKPETADYYRGRI